ncbi:MAG TPA: class I SAM-dependent methyltransferase [Puia sp.]|nr:class I SAM-dependent methyltransferase [Puia sp.]
MYSSLRLAQKYFRYWLTAANGKGHGIHSPFVFDFVTKVLNDKKPYPAYDPIEGLRRRLLGDNTLLEVEDQGAGSAYAATRTRSIADIARRAAKPSRLGQLLHRVALRYQPSTIIELGASLGLSAAYLASGAPAATLYTIEGAPAIAAAAERNLRSLHLPATILPGAFDDVLPGLLPTLPPVDLAFVDGNHRLDPTLRYFDLLLRHSANSSVLIFDDIHWSAEMETAWATIKADPRVYLTIDLFFIGFVFRRDEFRVKQDFVIRF